MKFDPRLSRRRRPLSAAQRRRRGQKAIIDRTPLSSSRSTTVDRWAPQVDHYEGLNGAPVETVVNNKIASIGLRPSSPEIRVVLHPPLASGNKIKFAHASLGNPQTGPARLCRWEYVEGNSVSKVANWKTYSLPTGEKAHFYENRRGIVEQPVHYPATPVLPIDLASIFHDSLPWIPGSKPPPKDALLLHTEQIAPGPDAPSSSFLNNLIKDFDDDISFFKYSDPVLAETSPIINPEGNVDLGVGKRKWDVNDSIFRARKLGETDFSTYFDSASYLSHGQNAEVEGKKEKISNK